MAESGGVPHGSETSATSETMAGPAATGWPPPDEYLDEYPDEPEILGESWSTTLSRAGALLLVGLGAAGLIMLAHWALNRPKTVQAVPPPTTIAPATASATAAIPTSITSTPDQDQGFVQALNDQGISFGNPDTAVHNGKLVCDDIRRGVGISAIVTAFQADNPNFADHAKNYVAISVRTYCPQSANLLPAGY